MQIDEVEGIRPMFRDKLAGAGVSSTEDLLEQGGNASGRGAWPAARGSRRTSS